MKYFVFASLLCLCACSDDNDNKNNEIPQDLVELKVDASEISIAHINGKTNCSLFSKHFAQDFVLLTQNKMYILLFPIICFSDFVLSLLLLS